MDENREKSIDKELSLTPEQKAQLIGSNESLRQFLNQTAVPNPTTPGDSSPSDK